MQEEVNCGFRMGWNPVEEAWVNFQAWGKYKFESGLSVSYNKLRNQNKCTGCWGR